ncbi:MAG: 16S rRNA (cytosine(1402)-N(4))-methyltransferase, partial [Chlamydiae bacterium]
MENIHTPVLEKEAIEFMKLMPGAKCIDMTVGLGGHSKAILGKTSPDGKMLCFDKDAETLKLAKERLEEFGSRVEFV